MTMQCPVLAGLIIGLMFFAGCTGRMSRLEVDYGTSFMLAKLHQTLNPEAGGQPPDPVYGLDGQAARRVVEGYRQGFGNSCAATGNTQNINRVNRIEVK
ncbi:MAG: hypothetical protein AB1611_15380 [bacterium]